MLRKAKFIESQKEIKVNVYTDEFGKVNISYDEEDGYRRTICGEPEMVNGRTETRKQTIDRLAKLLGVKIGA